MAKIKIDKLDLKKRKADLERGRLQQQVHIRLDSRGSRQREEEEDRSWENPNYTAPENEVTNRSPHYFAEGGPGEITTPSFLDKVSQRLAKFKTGSPALKMNKRNDDLPPQRIIPIRSSGLPRQREEVDLISPPETVNLRQRPERRERKIAQEVPIKSFEERIAEKTRQRIEAENGLVEPRQEEVAPAPVEEREEPRLEVPVSVPSAAPAETEEAPISVPVSPQAAAPSNFHRGILDNGLKMITAPIVGTKTVTALMMFSTGSKYESLSVSGLSHFLEHMFFKGTKRRSSPQILSNDLDALGCEYNAFTAKEYTGYWIKVDSSKISIALDILSDMLLNSEFPSAEITKERGVIIEEINMYHENPTMYIEDVFESCLYGDTPAGREIAGPKSNIDIFKRQNFVNYFESQYGANAAVLCLAGDVNEKTERLAARYFSQMKRTPFKDKIRTPDIQKAPALKMHYKEGDQAIISLGVRAYDTYHEDKVALKVLAVLLGGSMSSRMFTEVREKRGLAYMVHTTAETYTDTGYLTTQAGIPVGKQDQAIKVILGEYKKLKKTLVGRVELKRAKDLIKGRTVINFEASDNVANWYAQKAILKENLLTPEEYFAKIDKVKAEDIRRVAKDIFKDEKLNLAVIGPFQDSEEFEKLLKL
jgi:predicted Zn-dependent peptidase